ncbi:hypothetical protein QCN27_15720 [Cereibacter sp. SYSU M97828]|nr:hypothetical protein [Cereibacter flavus]
MIGKGTQTGLNKRRIPSLNHRGEGRPAELAGVVAADEQHGIAVSTLPDTQATPPSINEAARPQAGQSPSAAKEKKPKKSPAASTSSGGKRFWLALQMEKQLVDKVETVLSGMEKNAKTGARRNIGNAVRQQFLETGGKPKPFRPHDPQLFEISITLPDDIVERIIQKQDPHQLQPASTVIATAIGGYVSEVLTKKFAGI